MRIVIKEPAKVPRTMVIDGSLRTMQELVGGYIEHLPFCVLGVGMLMNEEGKLKDLPFNFRFYGDDILGTVIFVGEDGGEEFKDLSEEQRDSVIDLFSKE